MTSSQLDQALEAGTISRGLYDSMHPYIDDSAERACILLDLEKEFKNILKKAWQRSSQMLDLESKQGQRRKKKKKVWQSSLDLLKLRSKEIHKLTES